MPRATRAGGNLTPTADPNQPLKMNEYQQQELAELLAQGQPKPAPAPEPEEEEAPPPPPAPTPDPTPTPAATTPEPEPDPPPVRPSKPKTAQERALAILLALEADSRELRAKILSGEREVVEWQYARPLQFLSLRLARIFLALFTLLDPNSKAR